MRFSIQISAPGDLNNTDPQLGPLHNNGGATQTMAFPSGSRAIDAGNPNGCTDSLGNPLKTDQRGKPRPPIRGTRVDATLGPTKVRTSDLCTELHAYSVAPGSLV